MTYWLCKWIVWLESKPFVMTRIKKIMNNKALKLERLSIVMTVVEFI